MALLRRRLHPRSLFCSAHRHGVLHEKIFCRLLLASKPQVHDTATAATAACRQRILFARGCWKGKRQGVQEANARKRNSQCCSWTQHTLLTLSLWGPRRWALTRRCRRTFSPTTIYSTSSYFFFKVVPQGSIVAAVRFVWRFVWGRMMAELAPQVVCFRCGGAVFLLSFNALPLAWHYLISLCLSFSLQFLHLFLLSSALVLKGRRRGLLPPIVRFWRRDRVSRVSCR